MQVALRRLIIVGAISLFGGTAGVTLGNFVARGPKLSGADELANYSSPLMADAAPTHAVDPDPDIAARIAGPSHYDCTGCDASPYNDTIGGNVAIASTAPLPPYHAEESPAPAARREVPGTAVRRGDPPGSAEPAAFLASPAGPPPIVAPSVAVALPQTPPRNGGQ
ncbi:hypothetical protein [Sphingobium nicotianae]|uniref:Uncharacterized protein n=1 Tax=Sphingobium nicotianae TaxID=2782607 RepID=A0A9X1IRK8_9SPHN|nr:hypothetical protein [Sphingobium nicotianae]MBT2187591.1 hypothetical protein [Sphingobium nicotianae]